MLNHEIEYFTILFFYIILNGNKSYNEKILPITINIKGEMTDFFNILLK